jgi:carboxyl-terminal processing protease
MLNEEAWLQYLNREDRAVSEALQLFQKGEAFPKPTPPEE